MDQAKAEVVATIEVDQLCVNTLRFLAVDAVQKANSGHPGLPMGAAPLAYVLWTKFLKHNPVSPSWFDRDRFVLSAGHGSMLLYGLLHLSGYNLSLEDIKQFRQFGSKTPGHPERGYAPGVELTTGPLGQGFANGVGLAIAEAYLAARYNRPGHALIDHYTYALVSDGDLMEGVSAEAGALAGHLKLGKLIYLYDNNGVSLAASTNLTFTEDCRARFEAQGWQTLRVHDGNDLEAIEEAIAVARAETQRPSLIEVCTHIAYGAPHKQDTFEAHGSPLGADEVRLTKAGLNWPAQPEFHIPVEALAHFREALTRGSELERDWQARLEKYRAAFPQPAAEFERVMKDQLAPQWDAEIPSFPADKKGMATRAASGKVMNALALTLPNFLGGSADLNPSTFTALKGQGDFQPPGQTPIKLQGACGGTWSYAGRNLHFGVREHAMGAIVNGLAAHGGLIPYGATFLLFSDYMRPPLRLASVMKLHVIHIFTHDSIGLGEDGPTHQPVEQLASLRAIPDLTVIRPCDANETAVAWKVALGLSAGPVALILSRQNVPTLDRSQFASAEGLRQGAYILADCAGGKPELILIASGSEVQLIVAACEELRHEHARVRLVSMPSWELFNQQPRAYRELVLPPDVPLRLAVEAGSPQGWCSYVGDSGAVIGIDRFGASAPGEIVLREYGFTVEHICQRALGLLEQSAGEIA